MGTRTSGLLLVPAAAVVLIATGSAAGAPASAADRAVAVVARSVPLTPDLERRIRAYWTPRRMLTAAAAPIGRPVAGRPTVGMLATGPPVAGEPAKAPVAARREAASTGAVWTGGGAVTRTSGKVFFTTGGRDFLCSASTVHSANRDVVVTAGHCVKPDGVGAWADNWIFVPGYRDGAGEYGGFTARRMFVPDQWSRDADGDFDVAMVALAPADGRHVVDAAGGQRLAFGGPGGRRTHAFGYPATGRYDGERLAYCDGRPAPDPREATTGTGLRCDMTRGSSGGPWLTDFDTATGHGVIRSVSSFKYADDRTTMYGPYFGDAVRRVFDRAQHA